MRRPSVRFRPPASYLNYGGVPQAGGKPRGVEGLVRGASRSPWMQILSTPQMVIASARMTERADALGRWSRCRETYPDRPPILPEPSRSKVGDN